MKPTGTRSRGIHTGRGGACGRRVLTAAIACAALHAAAAGAQTASSRDTGSVRQDGDPTSPSSAGAAATTPLPDAPGATVPVDGSVGLTAPGPFDKLEHPGILADTGTYVYALSSQESDDVRAAIERAIAHMGLIPRQIARHRLIRANRPPSLLTFALGLDTLAVTFDGMNPIATPLNGAIVRWKRGTTRETYDVHVAFAGDTVRQIIAADDGQRENDFVFRDGGATIEMHVTLQAQRLPTPLHYVEVFREVRSQPDQSLGPPGVP